MTHHEQSASHMTLKDVENPVDGYEERPIKVLSPFNKDTRSIGKNEGGSSTVPLNDRDIKCVEISTIYELEQYYISTLGWNKFHMKKKEGNKIIISRPDRRVASHLLALLSSFSLYTLYADPSKGSFGLSVDLQALIIANCTFITAYAGEILVGPYSEVVDAKSERYGIIVTRAIDQGYFRGFHLPNGDWLMYKNVAKFIKL